MRTVKMELSTLRLYGSGAIILGCFLFLYPQLMHPLIMTLFGLNKKPSEPTTSGIHDLPPHLREKAKMAESRSTGMRDELPDHIRRMRSGPHPGMRAAAAEQSKETRGSGKGMMGVILPMYAVGIVVYLVYTLFKVFNKKDEKSRDRRSPTRSLGKAKNSYEEAGDYSEDEDEMDMRKLQERLAETEAQMTKILSAMQAVQGKVNVAATSAMPEEGQGQTIPEQKPSAKDVSNNQGSQSAKHLDIREDKKPSSDSSQSSPGSSESYEMVNKPDKETPADDVETIQSETTGKDSDDTEQTEDNVVDEPEEVLMGENKKEDEEVGTVRQRLTKKEDTES